MRTVLHIQVKDFCTSVESAHEPELRRVPMAVCGVTEAGRDIVISRNNMAGMLGVMDGQVISQARLNCPGLAVLPPDFRRYLNYSNRLRAICADYTDTIEAIGLDELFLDVSACQFSAMDIALVLHRRAIEELGLTLRVGVSFNKAFAKLSSDMAAPASTMIITPENFRQKLWPRPAGELMYVDEQVRRKLDELGIHTIGELACADVNILHETLGIQGELLKAFAQGKDTSPIQRERLAASDSFISNSVAAPRILRSDSDVERFLQLLAASIAEYLCKLCLRGNEVRLEVVDCDYSTRCFQKKLPRPTALVEDITAVAHNLFRENWRWERPVRSLKLSVSTLSIPEGSLQFSTAHREELRRCELENAVGDLRRRFGHGIISRACLMYNGTVNTVHTQLA